MDFSHDSTSRLSAMDELMMGSPHASPLKPQNVSCNDDRWDSASNPSVSRLTIDTARAVLKFVMSKPVDFSLGVSPSMYTLDGLLHGNGLDERRRSSSALLTFPYPN